MSTRSVASGPSGISPLLVRNTIDFLKIYLKLLFQKRLKEREFPQINLVALISPLLKPDKSPSKAASYRPVALTEVFIRVFEKVIKEKLTKVVEDRGWFGRFQHGFRRSHSVASNLLIHHEKIIRNLEEGKVVESII